MSKLGRISTGFEALRGANLEGTLNAQLYRKYF